MWFSLAIFLAGLQIGLIIGFSSVWNLYKTTKSHLDEAMQLLSGRQARDLELPRRADRPVLRLLPKPKDEGV